MGGHTIIFRYSEHLMGSAVIDDSQNVESEEAKEAPNEFGKYVSGIKRAKLQ